MADKKRVYIYPGGSVGLLGHLSAALAALDCVDMVTSESAAAIVVVLTSGLPDGAELLRLMKVAAGRCRLLGVAEVSGAPVPDALRVVGWGVIGMTASELHDAICLERLPAGGGGFPPRGRHCGNKDR